MTDFDIAKLRTDLVRDEGTVPFAYTDSMGYWTIGVGHLIDRRLGGGLPPAIIGALLDHDIAEKAADLDANIPWWRDLDDVRRRILLNMCFNMGWGKLAAFKNTLAAVQAGRWADAAAGMRASLWAKQVPKRAERLAVAMETGAMPA